MGLQAVEVEPGKWHFEVWWNNLLANFKRSVKKEMAKNIALTLTTTNISAIKQDTKCGFRIFTKLALDLRHFCSVNLPQLQVLDYLYFFDNTCWYCLLKKLLHGDKALAFGVQILQSKVFLVNNLRDGIDPVFRQV